MHRLLLAIFTQMFLPAFARPQFALVFDAGSSGTRLYVYRYYNVDDHVPVFDMSRTWSFKTKPGVANLVQDLPKLEATLQSMLVEASKNVPEKQRPASMVQFLGTAGLRTLSQNDLGIVLDTVRKVLDKSEFMFRPDWARMITGTEEGGFSWIAQNYNADKFADDATGKTNGILEMGGGSIQAAFEIPANVDINRDDEFIFATRLGRKHRLYSHSYMDYGLDYATPKIGNMDPHNPCYHSVSRQHARDEDCFKAIQNNILRKSDAPGKYGDELRLDSVSLNGVSYLVVGAFVNIQNDVGMGLQGKSIKFEDFSIRAKAACDTNLNPCDPHQDTCCFPLLYQLSVLNAWGLSKDSDVEFVAQASWTLGAVIFATAGDPDVKKTNLKTTIWICSGVGAVCIVTLIVWKIGLCHREDCVTSKEVELGERAPVFFARDPKADEDEMMKSLAKLLEHRAPVTHARPMSF